MKKLLTIICALSLVMLFALPAMADRDGFELGLDETQLGLNIGSAQANAGDDAVANDGLMFDDYGKDVTVNKSYSKSVEVNKETSIDIDDSFNYKKDVDIDKTTNVTKTYDKSINLDNSDAAIAYGGMAVRMDDLELNKSCTSAGSSVWQKNGIKSSGAYANGNSDGFRNNRGHDNDDDAGIEVEAKDLCMDIDFTENIGLGAGTFSQGNFTNDNAGNNVTMSVQW